MKQFRQNPSPGQNDATSDSKPNMQRNLRVVGYDQSTALPIRWRRVGLYLVLALGFFLLGAVPMWLRAREIGRQRDLAQHQLRLSEMQTTLASAVIDARRGEYEPARQTASDFFSDLRNQVDATQERTALTSDQRSGLKPLLAQRDDLITLLARDDPGAADRLSNLYVSYRKAMFGNR